MKYILMSYYLKTMGIFCRSYSNLLFKCPLWAGTTARTAFKSIDSVLGRVKFVLHGRSVTCHLYLYPYTLKESGHCISAPFECQWTVVPLGRMSQHTGASLFPVPVHLHQHTEGWGRKGFIWLTLQAWQTGWTWGLVVAHLKSDIWLRLEVSSKV